MERRSVHPIPIPAGYVDWAKKTRDEFDALKRGDKFKNKGNWKGFITERLFDEFLQEHCKKSYSWYTIGLTGKDFINKDLRDPDFKIDGFTIDTKGLATPDLIVTVEPEIEGVQGKYTKYDYYVLFTFNKRDDPTIAYIQGYASKDTVHNRKSEIMKGNTVKIVRGPEIKPIWGLIE